MWITPRVGIRRAELEFAYSRSRGPGGQNVNKVSTRVTLRFDLGTCDSLSEAQKHRLRERLATRITRRDVLLVVSSKHRTQAMNRRAATERFVELVAGALQVERRRRGTVVPQSSRRRRLDQKRRRGQAKRLRGLVPPSDER